MKDIFIVGVYALSFGSGLGWFVFSRREKHVEMLLCAIIWVLLMILLKLS